MSEELTPYESVPLLNSLLPDRLSTLFQVLMHDFYSDNYSDKEKDLLAFGLLKIINDRRDDLINIYIEKFMDTCEKWIVDSTGLDEQKYRKQWLTLAPLLVGYNLCNDDKNHIRHCIINLDHHQLGLRAYYNSIIYLIDKKFYAKWKTEIALTVESNLKAKHFCNEEGLYLLTQIMERNELLQLCNRWKWYHKNAIEKKLNNNDLEIIENIVSNRIELPDGFYKLEIDLQDLYMNRLMSIAG